ncbi:MAG TPA: tRNA uridine-5-carboxymethylaminomethyl(34) synthesis GTPase MnmE [Phycisphaerae bacterium]|nr:tRNA uridine-5-carboxymethylaminomethyl(34) synthesis GTPase MnmE [Phycisphaerae bacterium]
MSTTDTIVAISSAASPAYRGIIRLSGPDSWKLAFKLVHKVSDPQPNHWFNVQLADPPVPVGLIFFRAPKSFTGQDIVELHLPGSVPLLNMILKALISAGARQALPGEFSSRAFLNSKMDLSEAEGIAAVIAARSAHQLRAATSLREGSLHRWTARHVEELADLLALVEAGIDFSDEPGVSFISPEILRSRLDSISADVQKLRSSAVNWESLPTTPAVVLLGRPNVGKSSLLNSLSKQNRAIVSPQAGTTRDQLSVTLTSDALSIRLIDAPGIEAGASQLSELMNQTRRNVLLTADVILIVLDKTDTSQTLRDVLDEVADINAWKLVVRNKIDLPDGLRALPPEIDLPFLSVSALTGENLDELFAKIKELAHRDAPVAHECATLNRRHLQALSDAHQALNRAREAAESAGIDQFPELLASDLRAALDAMGEISGEVSSDDILGRIFGSFCIGK